MFNQIIRHNPFTPFTPLLLSWIGVALLMYPSSHSLWEQWAVHHAGYSHGVMILALIFYLLACKKGEYSRTIRLHPEQRYSRHRHWASPLLLMASLLWAVAYLMDVQLLQWMILPTLMMGVSWQLYGLRLALMTSPPLLLIYLGIPFWDYLNPLLQQWAVYATTALLQIINLPAEVDGYTVSVPYGQFRIADGCSGLRYFLVSLTLALLYGYLYYNPEQKWLKYKQRITLILAALLIGTAFNWVRIFLIIYIGYATKMQSPLIHDHETFGWILFAVALIPIFYIAHIISPPTEHSAHAQHRSASDPALPTSEYWPKGFSWVVAALTITAGPLLVLFINAQPMKIPNEYPIHIPYTINNWMRTANPAINTEADSNTTHNQALIAQWQPHFINTDQTSDTYFKHPQWTHPIRLSLRLYFKQHQEAELIFYHNHLYDEDHFKVIRTEQIPFLEGQATTHILKPYTHNTTHTQPALSEHILLISLYYVGGHTTTSAWDAKRLQLRSRVDGRGDGALIAVATHCRSDCALAQTQGVAFLESFMNSTVLP